MKEIKNYEHGFTKKTDREAIRAMAKVFFETDYGDDFDAIEDPVQRANDLEEICEEVSQSAIQNKEQVSFVARDSESGDILGFLAVESFKRNSVMINWIITNKEYKVSLIYKDFLIKAMQYIIGYFGRKKIYIRMTDRDQKGASYFRRTFPTRTIASEPFSYMEIDWSKYFFENNIQI